MKPQTRPEERLAYPLQLIPVFRDYVWGGQRLRPGQLTAEAWVIFEENRIASGPLAGSTLAQVTAKHPTELLGARAAAAGMTRFPLLIKLLDCAQWLSLQVHPDDALALALEGPEQVGKTEAWHVLDAAPGAQIIAGLRPGATTEALADILRGGTILDWAAYRDVQAGDTIFMPARIIHALGPGLLVYEVQQSSDITYRVYDWGRPPTPGRELHIDRSLAAADPTAQGTILPGPTLGDGGSATLAACPYFTLALLNSQTQPIRQDTEGRSFHALTVIEGAATLVTPGLTSERSRQPYPPPGQPLALRQYDSVVVPAACGPYEIRPVGGGCRVLLAGTAGG